MHKYNQFYFTLPSFSLSRKKEKIFSPASGKGDPDGRSLVATRTVATILTVVPLHCHSLGNGGLPGLPFPFLAMDAPLAGQGSLSSWTGQFRNGSGWNGKAKAVSSGSAGLDGTNGR